MPPIPDLYVDVDFELNCASDASIEEGGLFHCAAWFELRTAKVEYFRFCMARQDFELLDNMAKEQRVWSFIELSDKPVTCLVCLGLNME